MDELNRFYKLFPNYSQISLEFDEFYKLFANYSEKFSNFVLFLKTSAFWYIYVLYKKMNYTRIIPVSLIIPY